MRRSLALRIGLSAAVLATACSSSTGPAGPVSVRLAGASFARAAGAAANVGYTVANDGTAVVQLTGSCGEDPAPRIERNTDAGWTQYAGGLCPAIYSIGAVVLAPGAARQASVSVADAGEYRLVLGTDRGQIASAAFTVR